MNNPLSRNANYGNYPPLPSTSMFAVALLYFLLPLMGHLLHQRYPANPLRCTLLIGLFAGVMVAAGFVVLQFLQQRFWPVSQTWKLTGRRFVLCVVALGLVCPLSNLLWNFYFARH